MLPCSLSLFVLRNSTSAFQASVAPQPMECRTLAAMVDSESTSGSTAIPLKLAEQVNSSEYGLDVRWWGKALSIVGATKSKNSTERQSP